MSGRIILMATLLSLGASAVWAHHILGIPHYAYDEDYPQTPVLTYKVAMGPNEVKMTCYPGRPRPGESCSLHIYIRDLATGELFDDTVTLTVFRDRLFGKESVVYGPMEAGLEEAIYKFYPTFAEEANYLIRIAHDSEGEPRIIDLPMVIGEPGSPWAVLGGVGSALAVFVLLIRAIRIKQRRRMAAVAETDT